MRALTQLRLLLWKNCLSQKRTPVFTALEFLLPLVLIGVSTVLLLALESSFEKEHKTHVFGAWKVMGNGLDLVRPVNAHTADPAILQPFNISSDCPFLRVERKNDALVVHLAVAYAPLTEPYKAIMEQFKNWFRVAENLTAFDGICSKFAGNRVCIESFNVTIHGKKDEDALVDYLTQQLDDQCNNPFLGGVMFMNDPEKEDQIKYKIRLSNRQRRASPMNFESIAGARDSGWQTARSYGMAIFSGPRNAQDNDGGSPGYWKEGFLTLQRGIDVALSLYLSGTVYNRTIFDRLTNVQLQRFPFPAYRNRMVEVGAIFLPMLIIFSFLVSVIYITRSIVQEKESRLKEYMKVMGLSEWVLWSGHFISNYAKLSVSVVVLTALLSPLMPQSNWSVILVFFLVYATSVIFFAFAMSAFFHSGTAATLMTVFGWLLLYFWYVLAIDFDAQRPFSDTTRLLMCLNPNAAMGYALVMMAQYETHAKGFDWSNLWQPAAPDQVLTMGQLLIMISVDAVILAVIACYVTALNPTGAQGLTRKPWFFLMPSYWFPSLNMKYQSMDMAEGHGGDQQKQHQDRFEPHLGDVQPEIALINLTKQWRSSPTNPFANIFNYKSEKDGARKAVDRLNLNIYGGQLTALLGRNGAGKSTTFSLLTGATGPSSGTAIVSGRDIRDGLPPFIGLCPQYNVLFSHLTVADHLRFFSTLKSGKYDSEEAEELIARLKLDEKRECMAVRLSGGQKRKLSLAIALIGGSRIVMLDEPTSGMDPGARRDTWSLLQGEKRRRCILLSTHYMAEADMLADRIAILVKGSLHCCGTAMFLKKRYGVGYHLTVVLGEKSCDGRREELDSLVRDHCVEASQKRAAGVEMAFQLPAAAKHRFSQLFRRLESLQRTNAISSFGLSVTTMEDVFLKVGELADEECGVQDKTKPSSAESQLRAHIKRMDVTTKEKGMSRWRQQVKALLIKRAILFFRRWSQFIPQLIIPIVYLTLLVWVTGAMRSLIEDEPLALNMSKYNMGQFDINKKQKDSAHVIVFSENSSVLRNWFHIYKRGVEDQDTSATVQFTETDNFTRKVLTLFRLEGARRFGVHYPVGAKFKTSVTDITERTIGEATAMFNNFGYHTPPLSLSLIDTLMLRLSVKKRPNVSIEVINHPLPPTASDILKTPKQSQRAADTIASAVIVALSLMVSGYSSFLIRERKKKVKHMQVLSGVHPATYWLSIFIWDALSFATGCALCLLVFTLLAVDQYSEDLTAPALVLLSYGWASLPSVYCASFFFQSAPKGYALIVLFHILTGMGGSVAVHILTLTGHTSYLFSICLSAIFPTYGLARSFSTIYTNFLYKNACAKLSCAGPITAFANLKFCCAAHSKGYTDNLLFDYTKKGIGVNICLFVICGFVFWTVLFLIEFNTLEKLRVHIARRRGRLPNSKKEEEEKEDGEVAAEKGLTQRLAASRTTLLARSLSKSYGRLRAVKSVSFHVNAAECFGLLGVNGAGKTSTFQMLTGETLISGGDAFVQGVSIKDAWRKAGEHIGYCPQFDTVIGELSGRETLTLYARIRGIPEKLLAPTLDTVIAAVGLHQCASRLVNTYSGGMKRRLSLAVAVVGMPRVILLDEPTAGVDATVRRQIWQLLISLRETDRALLLCSHSMDECELLCSRVALMKRGLVCRIGSCQQLKSSYGTAYTLLLRMSSMDDIPLAKQRVERLFPASSLIDEHLTELNYEVPRSNSSWSELFEEVDKLVGSLNIVDYSLAQTTLEQVFLRFCTETVASTHPFSTWI